MSVFHRNSRMRPSSAGPRRARKDLIMTAVLPVNISLPSWVPISATAESGDRGPDALGRQVEAATARMVRGQDPACRRLRRQVRYPVTTPASAQDFRQSRLKHPETTPTPIPTDFATGPRPVSAAERSRSLCDRHIPSVRRSCGNALPLLPSCSPRRTWPALQKKAPPIQSAQG